MHLDQINQSEMVLFKKKLVKLGEYKGKGTELITVYIPFGTDRSSVMGQLTEEISQSSNIKSPTTRKNVQGALRKIINFLKQINFKIPNKGMVVFAGNVSEVEGKSDIRLFTLKPVSDLRTKLYWCDSQFHLEPLKEMAKPSEIYGLITIDKNEATIASLVGKKYEILGKFTSGVAGKTRAGGQSAKRFEHLREEAAQDFYKRISEKVNQTYLPYGDKLKGIIIGGPGITKNYFLNKDLIDHRLKKLIISTVDISYTDESGVRELVQRSEEVLRDTDLMKERSTINGFLEEVAKDSLAAYGEKEVNEALKIGKVKELLLSEDLDWEVIKFQCNSCGLQEEKLVKDVNYEAGREKCEKCKGQTELLEEVDYLDYMLEKAAETGAELKIISTDTPEGEQFLKGFGGIGAILRYR